MEEKFGQNFFRDSSTAAPSSLSGTALVGVGWGGGGIGQRCDRTHSVKERELWALTVETPGLDSVRRLRFYFVIQWRGKGGGCRGIKREERVMKFPTYNVDTFL